MKDMKIEELCECTPRDLADMQALMRVLSERIDLDEASLKRCLADSNAHLFVVRNGKEGRIVGCAELCVFHQPFVTNGTIESVAVLPEFRGCGLGRQLMQHILDVARRMAGEEGRAIELHLTSRPKRIEANALYRKMGFELYATNFYRMDIQP